jgi:hypothetical protein
MREDNISKISPSRAVRIAPVLALVLQALKRSKRFSFEHGRFDLVVSG